MSAVMFNDCQLGIRIAFSRGLQYFMSPLIPTKQTYPHQLAQQINELGIKLSKQQFKVVQYQTEICRKSCKISTCVLFYVNADLKNLGVDNIEEKMKSQGYKLIDKNDPIANKIRNKDFTCLQFLSQQGDTVAVYEKN